ncbi:phosphoribosylanthranilate isomerase [soil metagenome]
MAARLGADAIGIVRAEGAGRYVTIEEAKAIAAAVPEFVTPVLLYVNATAEQILEDLRTLDRTALVQLNGDETPEFIARLLGTPVFKSVQVDVQITNRLKKLREAQLGNLAGIVLESPGQTGGSGVNNNWQLAASLVKENAFADLPPLIAAGGLTPQNVGQVIRAVHPYAVDVSTGVEETKRQKSEEKVKAFISAVQAADR